MVKQRLKSKTYWLAIAITVLGAVQANYPHIKELLGEHSGIAYTGIAVLVALLRELTKEPVSAK